MRMKRQWEQNGYEGRADALHYLKRNPSESDKLRAIRGNIMAAGTYKPRSPMCRYHQAYARAVARSLPQGKKDPR